MIVDIGPNAAQVLLALITVFSALVAVLRTLVIEKHLNAQGDLILDHHRKIIALQNQANNIKEG